MGNTMFVYEVREIIRCLMIIVALGCFAYGAATYYWKEWRKSKAKNEEA